MKIFAVLACVCLLGCSSEVGDPEPVSDPAPQDDVAPSPPRGMPPVYESEDPCERVQEYTIYGRIVQIPTWCDSKPFIYKGYPSPVDKALMDRH